MCESGKKNLKVDSNALGHGTYKTYETTFVGFEGELSRHIPGKIEGYKLVLELIGLPKRYNQGQGAHWTSRYRESQKWHKRLLGKMVLMRATPPKMPLKKATLKLTRYSSRAPDYDGLVQSFKPVVDALKKCLIIHDDSMDVIGKPDYSWEKAGQREGKIVIEVIEVVAPQPF